MRILVFEPDGRIECRHVVCKPGDLADIHAVVDPIIGSSHLEHVNVFWIFGENRQRYLDAFVHGEGHLIGLPFNRTATIVYHNNIKVHRPQEYVAEQMPGIVGPMVLFEEKVWL